MTMDRGTIWSITLTKYKSYYESMKIWNRKQVIETKNNIYFCFIERKIEQICTNLYVVSSNKCIPWVNTYLKW